MQSFLRVSRVAAGLALTTAMALSLAACGGAAKGGSTTTASNTVTIALESDAAPTGYDPLLYAQGQSEFYSALYDSLFVTQQDGSVKPSLVTEFTPNSKKTEWTLKLRSGVTFSDGSTLDATLVKANLDRRSDKDLTSYGILAKGGSAEITNVVAKDASTVVITFAQPQGTPQNSLADEAGMIIGSKGVADPTAMIEAVLRMAGARPNVAQVRGAHT